MLTTPFPHPPAIKEYAFPKAASRKAVLKSEGPSDSHGREWEGVDFCQCRGRRTGETMEVASDVTGKEGADHLGRENCRTASSHGTQKHRTTRRGPETSLPLPSGTTHHLYR